jgi:nucleoside-triphosphatase THEP1
MNAILVEKLIDNYKYNLDVRNFIRRTKTVINKANESNDTYAIDEIKPNELLMYKTKSIKHNPEIKEYIGNLMSQGVKVEFKQFDTAVNKIIVYNKNMKTLEVIEYLDN